MFTNMRRAIMKKIGQDGGLAFTRGTVGAGKGEK